MKKVRCYEYSHDKKSWVRLIVEYRKAFAIHCLAQPEYFKYSRVVVRKFANDIKLESLL